MEVWLVMVMDDDCEGEGNNGDCRCYCLWGLQGRCFGRRLHRSNAHVFYVSINKFRKHIQLDIDMRFTLQIQALGWLAAVFGASNTILKVIVPYFHMSIIQLLGKVGGHFQLKGKTKM